MPGYAAGTFQVQDIRDGAWEQRIADCLQQGCESPGFLFLENGNNIDTVWM
jgi:hypothetical protein